MTDTSQSLPLVRATAEPSTLFAMLIASSLGAALVFTVGFAHPELIHNAAHDWRHSMNFPCH
ncbi:MAG: CbtB-domain containing protein [Rhizobiales bacterium]|nr:CbtB-domain containing protein [Hyphomicrobiales bacterium]